VSQARSVISQNSCLSGYVQLSLLLSKYAGVPVPDHCILFFTGRMKL